MIPDAHADRLAAVAAELAVRVRDDSPEANARWLAAELPDPADWFRLAFTLAAVVPDDRTWGELTAWARSPRLVRPRRIYSGRPVKPCGTPAAAKRHEYRGEPLCGPCREAVRARDRERKQRKRAEVQAA